MIKIKTFSVGPMQNNSYLIIDGSTNSAAIVDPSYESEIVVEAALDEGLRISHILITHAHFDHIMGIPSVLNILSIAPEIAICSADLPLWKDKGNANTFGISLPSLPDPTKFLSDGTEILLGSTTITAFHTPGHTPGHLAYYIAEANSVFVGDLIFYRSIGRTDLTGGDQAQLIDSIKDRIFSLPGSTQILPGHGPSTTVADEISFNPFLV
jgi:hydroxyacylglutathione hydrolase